MALHRIFRFISLSSPCFIDPSIDEKNDKIFIPPKPEEDIIWGKIRKKLNQNDE